MKFYALRKPARPILYALLLVLITVAALVFSLQALLDSLVLKNATVQYAYVVSPYGFEKKNPTMAPIDKEIQERLQNDKNVSFTQQTVLRAGRLEGTYTVPDDMMTTDAVTQKYFLEGYISGHGTERSGDVIFEHFTLIVTKNWGTVDCSADNAVTVSCARTAEDSFPEKEGPVEGRVFLIGDFVFDGYGVNNKYLSVHTDAAERLLGLKAEDAEESTIGKNRFIPIPAEIPEEETEAYILNKMEESGLLPIYQAHVEAENAVTVRYVSDMNLIPNVAKGSMYADWGRLITPADAEKKVCLVSNGLVTRNQLVLGQTIKIAVADGHYTVPEGQPGAGYESGYPTEHEEFLSYGEYEEYVIIGSYYQAGRSKAKSDARYNSVNDIFIPMPKEGIEEDFARPYTLSFQVPGDKYDAFLAQNKEPLREMGYNLRVVDNGWEDVADSFYAMADRRILIFLSATLCFLAAALSFGGLIFRHYQKEYGLCRLMGAYRGEAARVTFDGFLLSALPAAVLSVAASWGVYALWMKNAVLEETPIDLPGTWECLGILALLTVAELILSALFVWFLLWRREKKGVLQMR